MHGVYGTPYHTMVTGMVLYGGTIPYHTLKRRVTNGSTFFSFFKMSSVDSCEALLMPCVDFCHGRACRFCKVITPPIEDNEKTLLSAGRDCVLLHPRNHRVRRVSRYGMVVFDDMVIGPKTSLPLVVQYNRGMVWYGTIP